MAKQLIDGQADSANGTEQLPHATPPVSGLNLGELLDEAALASLVQKSILDEEGSQAAAPPAPRKGETEQPEPSQQPPADAEQAAQDTDTDEPDLSQPDDEEDDAAGLPEGVKKRLAKLTAKRRAAEEEASRTKAEVERLRQEMDTLRSGTQAPAPAPADDNPFRNLARQEDVDREIAQARKVRRWCEENPDGTVITDAKGNETEYSAEQIRKIRLNAVDALEEHLPRQLAYIRESAKYDQVAENIFPWWKERSSPQRQMAEQVLAQAPDLKRFPNYKLFIGDYILGMHYREAQAKLAGKKTVAKAPAQPGKPLAAPMPTSTASAAQAKAAQAKAAFIKSGKEEDLVQAVTNFL